MNKIGKYSRSGIVTSVLTAILGLFVVVAANAAKPDVKADNATSAVSNAKAFDALAKDVESKPSSRMAISMFNAAQQIPNSEVSAMTAVGNAKKAMQWTRLPARDRVGNPQSGYATNDGTTALYSASVPSEHYRPAQLYIFTSTSTGVPQIQLTPDDELETKFNFDGYGTYNQVDIVFEFPSGGKAHMKAGIAPGVNGSIIFTADKTPELIARLAVCSYMHVNFPTYDGGREMVFDGESFRNLQSPSDRKQLESVMKKTDPGKGNWQ